MRIAKDTIPQGFIQETSQAAINDPGITYNEPGVTYDDIRYTYGGLYGFSDVIPLISLAESITPSVINYADIYTQGHLLDPSRVLGPGFFLFITQ